MEEIWPGISAYFTPRTGVISADDVIKTILILEGVQGNLNTFTILILMMHPTQVHQVDVVGAIQGVVEAEVSRL